MRALLISLALLGACDGATSPFGDAPEAGMAATERSAVSRLDALEAYTAQLNQRLKTAEATIATLETELAAVQGAQAATDTTVGELAHQIQDSFATGHTLRADMDRLTGRVDALDGAVFETDPVTGERTDLVAAALRGPGRQGGHMTVLDDYQLALAGHDPLPADATADELRAVLFTTDPETGAQVPVVEGIVARMKKRPEILFEAWDTALNDYISDVVDAPLNTVTTTVAAVSARVDQLDKVTWYDPKVGDLLGTTQLGHFIDDWQGETAYLRATDDALTSQLGKLQTTVDEKPWVKHMEAKWPEWYATVSTDLKVAISGADERIKAGDAAVAAAASTEVKELADILKADYGKQIGGVQADVDALWAEVVAADADLQAQIDALTGAVCTTGDLADALYLGDDVAAAAAYAAGGGARLPICSL